MSKVTKHCHSSNGEVESLGQSIELDKAEKKSSKRRVAKSSMNAPSSYREAGFVTDTDDDEAFHENTTSHSDKPRDNDGALEALMQTPRESFKKSSSFSGRKKSQPLKKNKRGLLEGFKQSLKPSTSLHDDNSQRKADEILISLTSTPTQGPRARKSESKQMPDELWAVVSSHHGSKHGPDQDRSLDQESGHSSDSSSIQSFADESDHPEEDILEAKTSSHESNKIIRKASSNHSPVGRRGRRSRRLRLSTGNQPTTFASPLASNKPDAGAALERRKQRHNELSKSCHGRNVREIPFSPSQETKSTAQVSVDAVPSQILSPKPQHILHSMPQSPARRYSPARFSKAGGQNSRSNSEPRRKESRRIPKGEAKRIVEKYSRPQRGSSVGSGTRGHRRTSHQQGSEESRHNRDIVGQSMKRASSTANLDERRRSGKLPVTSSSPSLVSQTKSKKASSASRSSASEDVNSTGGRRRKPKVIRNATRKLVS